MKIQGPLIDMLVGIAPKVYEDFLVYKGKNKVLYVKMLSHLWHATVMHHYSITKTFKRILSPLDLKSIHMIPVLPTESSKANSTEYLGMLMI
jgi:hypothetical protein